MTPTATGWPTRDPLSHRASATPDRTALVDVGSGRQWRYRQLDGLVDCVARRLQDALGDVAAREAGPGTEDVSDRTAPLIGVLASTRVATVVAVHAGLRVGARLAPLNVRLADRELRDRLGRVEPALLLCERDTEEQAATADCRTLSIDEPGVASVEHLPVAAGGTTGGTVEPTRWAATDRAVLLFTSGTTGEPKGVWLTLGNLVASATAAAFRLGVAPGDRWLDCLPVYHMGGLAPLVRCPLYGTTLLVQRGFDAAETADAVGRAGATGVSLVPTQLKRMLDDGWQPPGALDTVLVGGAPAPEELVERALDCGVPVYPTYGLTEAASQVATATPESAGEFPGTVGQPLVVTDVTVVDPDGEPVPPGETGEVVIDGPTVTPGYLDPDRTTEAFGEYGLHTGDAGRIDADGRLWIDGRIDGTIVTGGENVHPAEVESVLRAHPSVADAAVVGLPDEEWGERVAALVATDGDATPAAVEVEAFARERLAGYKLPRTLAVAKALPRTASGTVDRDAVRDRLAKR
jgi:O-succinylbenzoic acid--CoA ligase